MFDIDLLKGQGIPIRSRPEGVAVAIVTVAVPVIIAIVMFGLYLSNEITMSIQKQEIAGYEVKINSGKLLKAMESQRSFEREKENTNSCLSEASENVGKYTQWSPVLMALVENIPSSVVLTKLGIKQQNVRKRVPKKGNPTEMVEVTLPAKILNMKLCGTSRDSHDTEIKNFKDRLQSSAYLGPKLEDIKISQGFDILNGNDVVAYEIECIFKPQL
ncbi:MAG: hypothetical protein KAS75_05960 [Planctomycetes bacterium]|nr:hypothetical protein [Planctomycetota bacterium]